MGERQEIAGGLLVAGGDAAIVLKTIDQPLNQIAALVFPAVVPPLNNAGFQRRDDCLRVPLPQQLQKRIGVISSIGNYRLRLMRLNELLSLPGIMLLSGT